MKKPFLLISILSAAVLFSQCRKAEKFSEEGYDERLSGGAATVFDETSKALGHEVPGLNERDARIHGQGDAAFEQTFVSDPAPVFGGLGPVFNNVSCVSCHHNDGKGTPTAGAVNSSLLFRITGGGFTDFGGPSPVDGYGNQIQDVSLSGVQAEAKINISYEEKVITYPDGFKASLRIPSYEVTNMSVPVSGHFSLSPRLAPPVFGLGLLENIPEYTIQAFAAENSSKEGSIKGHPNYVYNPKTKRTEIGRFGLKANTSTIFVQVAGAFQQDMGITSSLFPNENCFGQSQMTYVSNPGKPNLPDSTLNAVVFYIKSLAVPARRNVSDPIVRQGQQLFTQINCGGCHRANIQTGVDLSLPQISSQHIHPYTDLLLHDMGDGLADNYTDFKASGREWKTPALWGIGLFEKTNGTAYYLHDGRARTIEEAILWHSGEAEDSKNSFMQLSRSERDALIKFIKSL